MTDSDKPRRPRGKKPERPRRQIEREFGVPIAGEILDPAQWTQVAALKKLPETGPLDLAAIFGRTAPVVVDSAPNDGTVRQLKEALDEVREELRRTKTQLSEELEGKTRLSEQQRAQSVSERLQKRRRGLTIP